MADDMIEGFWLISCLVESRAVMNKIKNSCLQKAPTVADAEAAVPYSCSSGFQLKPLDFLGGGINVAYGQMQQISERNTNCLAF
jgi:hypothetical protein